jgi:hypothetical protein
MSTKLKVFLISLAALTSAASVVSAAPHAGGMGGSMPARSSPMFTHSGSGMFHNDGFDHFHHHTVIFIDAFGFPFFSPFPFYGYYPYPYPYPYQYGYYGYNYQGGDAYGYNYGDRSTVVAAQRRLARAGYYHGAIDGILGPKTRRAIRAYERDHNAPAYGVIDRQILTKLGMA